MSYWELTKQAFDEALQRIGEAMRIHAPVRYEKAGVFSDTDSLRYGDAVTSLGAMELKEKTHFSPKEAIFPIEQKMFHFNEEDFYPYRQDKQRPTLIFLRACDIHGVHSLDKVFLENGPWPDPYYQEARRKAKFVLIGCEESFDNCFCVSMGSNQSDDFAMALKVEDGKVFLHIKDPQFLPYFKGSPTEAFTVPFVQENKFTLTLPESLELSQVIDHPLWEEYNSRCIACGRCNFVCPTCTCTTTQDVAFKEDERVGERRRIWASCHVDGFSDMAGGHSFRPSNGERMRFKTMHKVVDFKKRFGIPMCVGCGRCDDVCPSYISYANCIKKLSRLEEEQKDGQ